MPKRTSWAAAEAARQAAELERDRELERMAGEHHAEDLHAPHLSLWQQQQQKERLQTEPK
jgi:hypothetical protein